MKFTLRSIFIIIISLALYLVVKVDSNSAIVSTMYNVASVMFSIGMGLIVTFSLNGIKNREYLRAIRREICRVRRLYIQYFSASTILYLLPLFLKGQDVIFSIWNFSIEIYSFLNLFSLVYIVFTIFYFVLNFIEIQKLKDDICDKIGD